jgi:hypothetical protein
MSASSTTAKTLADLYEADETAWLEAMAQLVSQRRTAELDYAHLSEYLSDMARRDRREVKSRLVALLSHLLKWEYQPDKRTQSWSNTIYEQREELLFLLESGTLRNHAEAVLVEAFEHALHRTVHETGLPLESLPSACPYTIDSLLAR